jgi:enamine deaminase RidA (YjgF/YER057c/UK114 family)
MMKTYFSYLPVVVGSIEEEWKQCIDQVNYTRSAGHIPIKINVFADLPDFNSFLEIRKTFLKNIEEVSGSFIPTINITVHPPEKPWKVVVEAAFIKAGSSKTGSKKFGSIPYVVLESETEKEVWAAGVSCYAYPDDTRKAAENAFKLMSGLLAEEKMSLDHIVRQWNYIGDILDVKDDFQNYQIFNEVRNEYYSRFRKVQGFPSATGVGMKYGGVILDFCAIKSKGNLDVIPVHNPDQVNAYNYGQDVLKGLTGKDKITKHPPQFERALLIANKHEAYLHVSGTASILGQETVGKDDIARQTVVTIENIRKLADLQRINKLLPGSERYAEKYSLLRVYIKSQDDFARVRAICDQQFPGIPATYIEADICRDDLLMEIEAEVSLGM